MAIVVPFLGENRIVFEEHEKGWGPDTTSNLKDLLETGDFVFFKVDGNIGVRLPSATLEIDDSDSVTPTAPVMKLFSSGGNASFTLEDGVQDGQVIEIMSVDDDGNFLTLAAGANVHLNGDMVFDRWDTLLLRWDDDEELWFERGRSN